MPPAAHALAAPQILRWLCSPPHYLFHTGLDAACSSGSWHSTIFHPPVGSSAGIIVRFQTVLGTGKVFYSSGYPFLRRLLHSFMFEPHPIHRMAAYGYYIYFIIQPATEMNFDEG